MTPLVFVVAVAITAVVSAIIVRALAGRQLAETRGAMAAQLAAVEQDNKWLRDEVERHKQSLGSTQELLDKTDARLREAFQSLAADALKDNRTSFFDLAKTSFEGYHQPITETLKRVDDRLGKVEHERVAAYSMLREQISAVGSSAEKLSRALRTPAVRGRWGEMQLRRVVEIAGMVERCDFDEQPALLTENGRLRPDLIVHLPGGKRIVVDAKAPLEAFLDAQETTDDEARAVKLQAHARQVREHMDKLGSKGYWEALDNSPEMVVMFLPGETLFSAALQHDLGLIEHGLQQRILLASPITLIALLTTVAHTWRQEALAENYREVAALGRELYERLGVLARHFDDLRRRLDGAVQAYNSAAASFEARVLPGARKLRDLNVTTAPELPAAEPIATVPRTLKQAGLLELEEAASDPEIT
jgi:DNA recombination protein RmuC